MENGSEHPLANAIVNEAKKHDLRLAKLEDFESRTGKGVSGLVNGKTVSLGNQTFMSELNIETDALKEDVQNLRLDGNTVMYVAIEKQLAGIVAVADPIKEETPGAIRALHELGLKIIMATGDNSITAKSVADRLGIDIIHADVLPQDKKLIIEDLQSGGIKVAMAGDGVNDAPALAQADVGIAMSSGADVAVESAGITLMKGDLGGVVRARHLATATMTNIKQNLSFCICL